MLVGSDEVGLHLRWLARKLRPLKRHEVLIVDKQLPSSLVGAECEIPPRARSIQMSETASHRREGGQRKYGSVFQARPTLEERRL